MTTSPIEPTEQRAGHGHRSRFDFVIETVSVNDDTGLARVMLKPDERRYHIVKDEAGTHYIDKYLRVLIPANVMAEAMAQQMVGLPVYSLEPSIESSRDYASQRQSAMTAELAANEHIPPTQRARSHRTFTDNPEAREVVFLSIDIVGASAMRRKDPEAFERAYRILFKEFASLIGQFQGSVLKSTGDGCIAYIDHPGFTSTCDAAADLGLSLLVMLRDGVRPALAHAGLEALSVRIGADYGMADVREIEVPATGFVTREVASDALNRAVKIEESCQPNEFRIGRTLYELVHVKWLERATEVDFDGVEVGMPGYKVYRLV